MRIRYLINSKTLKHTRCTEEKMSHTLSKFSPKFVSVIYNLRELKQYIAGVHKNKKILITKGFKHTGVYDVWYK